MHAPLLRPITLRYADRSTADVFSFSFFCDACGGEWRSTPQAFAPEEMASPVDIRVLRMLWGGQHMAAYERANLEAIYAFSPCPECGRRVCMACFFTSETEFENVCGDCLSKREKAVKERGVRMFDAKKNVLSGAPEALNKPEQPWEVTVEGDSLVARWRWMDAAFFPPNAAGDKTRRYAFSVFLRDNGKWKEFDITEENSTRTGMRDGKPGFGGSSSAFPGKATQKAIRFGVGKEHQTGTASLVGLKSDASQMKRSIRDYLTGHGWEKAGLFG